MPTGMAKPVDGGFRISGRWKYASGCEHCAWAFLGGVVEGSPDDRRLFVIPRSDYKIVDTWHVPGLKGTGSHDMSSRMRSCRSTGRRNTPTISAASRRVGAEHRAALPVAVRAGVLPRRVDRRDRRVARHARRVSGLWQEAHPEDRGSGIGRGRDPVALRRDRRCDRRDEDHPAPQLQGAGRLCRARRDAAAEAARRIQIPQHRGGGAMQPPGVAAVQGGRHRGHRRRPAVRADLSTTSPSAASTSPTSTSGPARAMARSCSASKTTRTLCSSAGHSKTGQDRPRSAMSALELTSRAKVTHQGARWGVENEALSIRR